MHPESPGTAGPRRGHLAILCDISGRITAVLSDEAGLFSGAASGQPGAPDASRALGRMLGRFVAPGGAQHFAHFLARLAAQGAVSEWLLDLQGPDAAVTYRLWAAQGATPDVVLVLGTSEPACAFEQVAQAVLAAAGPEPRAGDALARLRAHEASEAARADLREQVRGLQEQVQPPPGLDSRLLRMAAHDLRNPLLVLSMGCSYLLHEAQGLTEDQRVMLSESLDTCEFMNRLVDGMVDLAEVAVGRLRLVRQSAELAPLLEAAIRRSEELARARRSSIALVSAAPVSLAVDAARMAQVFGQLLSNALIHCPEGTSVRTWIERDERVVVIAVADDGPGIAPEMLPRLFRPFGKPHAAIDPRYYGAGVGLAVARRIVEGHDGRLDVETEPGQGSCFRVVLPLSDL
jgi:signal transduction histidine kinase